MGLTWPKQHMVLFGDHYGNTVQKRRWPLATV
jgi:hypothetical protein